MTFQIFQRSLIERYFSTKRSYYLSSILVEWSLFVFLGGNLIEEREIDALLIQPGDVLKVLPGTKIPADGVVVWGSSYVNESMVTGESIPVLKEVSSNVIGGTINFHGALHIQATKVGSDAVLNQIISLVETAQMSKAPIQKFADFVSIMMSSFTFIRQTSKSNLRPSVIVQIIDFLVCSFFTGGRGSFFLIFCCVKRRGMVRYELNKSIVSGCGSLCSLVFLAFHWS